jgi:hypothetical protein
MNEMKFMLKFVLWAMILGCFSLFYVNSGYAKIDPEKLLGMWLFDEKGEPGMDYSKNGFDGITAGNVMQVEGKFNKGINVTGGGSSITIGDNEKLNFGDKRSFSVVVWLNFGAAQDWNRIVRERTPGPWGGGNAGWELQTQTTQIHWSLDDKAGGNMKNTYDNVGNGDWHHTAMVVDREAKMLISYLDGANEKKIGIPAMGSVTTELPVVIGDGFNGLVDEVAIFDGILEMDDVALIMNAGLSEAVIKGSSVNSLEKLATTWGKAKSDK